MDDNKRGIWVLVYLVVIGFVFFALVALGGSFPIFKSQEQREKEAVEEMQAKMRPLIEDYKYHTRKAEEYEDICKRLSTQDDPRCSPQENAK